ASEGRRTPRPYPSPISGLPRLSVDVGGTGPPACISRFGSIGGCRFPPGRLSATVTAEASTALHQPEASPRVRSTLWFALAIAMTFAIRLKLATTVGGPILTDDGAGYLGNARWLAGVSTPDFTYSNAYGLGYPVLLAPFYAV